MTKRQRIRENEKSKMECVDKSFNYRLNGCGKINNQNEMIKENLDFDAY